MFDFVLVKPEVDARAEGSSVIIDAETIIFTTPKGTVALLRNATRSLRRELISCIDAEHFYSIFEAAKLYFCPSRDHINLDDFKGFILIAAVKNKCQDAILQLLEEPIAKIGSSDHNPFGSALPVASTLASQFIKHEWIDGLHEKSERDKSQTSLFSWAAQCGHTAVVQVLMEKGADVDAKDEGQETALHRAAESGHEAVVRLLLEAKADVDAKDKGQVTGAAQGGREGARGSCATTARGKGGRRCDGLVWGDSTTQGSKERARGSSTTAAGSES